MKHLQKAKRVLSSSLFAAAIVVCVPASAFAAPGQSPTQPPTSTVSGPQNKPAVEPGTKDTTSADSLGKTSLVKTNKDGTLQSKSQVSAFVGNVSSIDFSTPYNYCYKNLTYTTLKNNTAATQYAHIVFYNQSQSRDFYTSIAANSYSYPTFYGVDGSWSAYLYTWNGSSYQYDEYEAGTNTCNVSVTRTYNAGGWVQLKIQNTGTDYATQISTELAPYPGAGTYTGTQYDYPTAGGAAIYRWFNVGTSPYGISSYTYGSSNMPTYFTGDL